MDIDNILYFLLNQNTIAPLKKKQYFITDFLFSKALTKLLLPYPIRLYDVESIKKLLFRHYLYTSFKWIVPLK